MIETMRTYTTGKGKNTAVVIGEFGLSVALVAACMLPQSVTIAEAAEENATQSQEPSGSQGSAPEPPDGSGADMGTPPGSGSDVGVPPDGEGGSSMGEPPDGGGGGANTMSFDYSGSYAGALSASGTDEAAENESLEATESGENVVLATDGGTLTVAGSTLTKSGDNSDGDTCNFYGVNSITLAVGEATSVYLFDSTLSATSEGSNGVFSTDGATVFANDIDIATTSDNSRGLDATYGGTIIANALAINTQGEHCAAVATDRGGGYISATNSDLSTAGSGSPLLYSTGAIEVDNVTGTAAGSQIAGMEGLNTIRIANSELSSTITEKTASDPLANGVIIYQSTSGDAEATTGETAVFEASDSVLSSSIASGAMFYITNTAANIVLSNTDLNFDSDAANLITVAGNDSNNWGSAGKNGADVTLTGLDQELTGNIEVDTISSLNLYLLEGTTFTGSASITENSEGSTSDAPITVNIENGSTWVVTEDSTVSNLNVEFGTAIVDENGDTVSIAVDGQIAVAGESPYTITVSGTYSDEIEVGESNALSNSLVDRAEFDAYFGTATTFGANAGDAAVASNASGSSLDSGSDSGEESDADSGFGFIDWLSQAFSSLSSAFGF